MPVDDRRARRALVTLGSVLALAVLATRVRAGESLSDLTGPWQLLIDDFLVESRADVTRTYHPLQKYAGNPVIEADRPWEGTNVYLYGTVLPAETGPGYRMWYHAFSHAEYTHRNCYATSADGIAWTKPNLGLFSWNGSTANNIHTTRTGPLSLLHTPFNPEPGRQYTHQGFQPNGYHGAWSADGLHWTDVPGNPLVPGGDVAHVAWDPHRQRYIGYYKVPAYVNGLQRRAVAFSETTDFTSWPAPQLILAPDDVDDRWAPPGSVERTHFYGFCVFPYESMYLGFLWVLRSVDDGVIEGKIHVEIASSHDGVHWTRQEGDRPAILELGPPGAWDDGMVFTSTHPLVEGDTLRLYYGGFDDTHAQESAWHANIGMATLRKDGFASLDAGATTGTVLTKKLLGLEGPLHVNYRSTGGWLKAEVLDESGQVVPGYEAEACNPVQGDSIDEVVTWAGHAELPAWPGPLRLRFILQNASLYSFRAGPAVSIIEPPTITRQPVDSRVLAGGTARFTVEVAAAASTSYQWQKDGQDLVNGGHYAGVNTPTLVVSPADDSDMAAYRCVVTHPYGQSVSDFARLILGTWAFTGIGFREGATSSSLNAMSSDGQIATGQSGGQAVIWSPAAGLKVLGLPSGATTSNGLGVGVYRGTVMVAVDTNRSSYRAHRWSGSAAGVGAFSMLPRAGGSREWLVRDLGTDGAENLWIAGSTLAGGDGNGREACLYNHSAAATSVSFVLPPNSHDHSDFNAVADNGYCAGQYQYGGLAPVGGARNAMKRESGAGCAALNTIMGSPSTAYEAIAWTISHNGRVLGGGSHYLPGALFKPVIWADSSIPTAIPFLAGGDGDNTGDVLALNGDGTLAGGYSYRSPGGAREAFIWDAVHGTRSLRQVLITEYDQELTGWTLQEVRSISSDGLGLAGVGVHDGHTEGWVVYFVPYPEVLVGDFDLDGRVDSADLTTFVECFTGPFIPLINLETCDPTDLDRDGDVDQSDFGLLQRCFTNQGEPVPGDCIKLAM